MDFSSLRWPLVIGLGTLALVRPLARIVGDQMGVETPALVPIALTVIVSLVWIAVVVRARVTAPVLTLTAAGVTYAVLSIVLSGVLSPILTGALQGPLANPVAIVPVLLVGAVWGAVCGLLALAVGRRRLRGDRDAVRPGGTPERRVAR